MAVLIGHARRLRAAPVCLAIALLAGCAAQPPPRPRVPLAVTPVEPAPLPPATWSLRPTTPTSTGEARESGQDEGATIFSFGVARLRLEGSDIEEAEERTLSPIEAFGRLGDGWVVVTSAGEIFRAEQPLGPLQLVGTLNGAPLGSVGSVALRLALLDVNGRLFVGDLDGVAAIDAPEPVVGACFASPTFGLRLDAGGAALQTLDGGESWAPLELPEGAGVPARVYPHGDGIILETSAARVFRAEVDQVVELPGLPAAAGTRGSVRRATLDTAERWIHGRGRLLSGIRADGRFLVGAGAGRAQLFPKGPELALPERCEGVRATGHRLWARCRGRWHGTDGSSAFTPLELPGALGPLTFDPASEWIAGRGSCDGQDHHALCLFKADDVSSARSIPVPGLGKIVGFGGGRLYGSRQVDWSPRAFSVDPEAGGFSDLEPALTPLLDAVAEDGTLLVYDATEHRYLVGEPGEFQPLALPPTFPRARLNPSEGFTILALDREHLIVAHREEVWISADGGLSFEEIPAARHRHRRRLTPAHCNARGCDLGDLLWAPDDVAPDYQPSVAHAEAATLLNLDDWHTDTLDSSPACEMPVRWSGRPLLTPPPPMRSRRQLVANGWVRIAGSSRAPFVAGPLRAELGGVDAEGSFRVRARSGSLRPLPPIEEAPYAEVSTRLLSVTRRLALLQRTRSGGGYRSWDLVAVGPETQARVVLRMSELSESFEFAPTLAGALPDLDGGVVVRATSEVEELAGVTRLRVDELIRISPDGSVRRRTFESGPTPSRRRLARDASGTPGLYVERPDEARMIRFTGEVSAPMPRPPEAVVRFCDAGARPALEVLTLGSPAYPPRVALRSWRGAPRVDARVVVALDPEAGACVREFWAVGPPSEEAAELLTGALHASTSHGEPIGRLLTMGREGALGVECTFVASTTEQEARPSPRRHEAREVVLGTLLDGTVALAVGREREVGERATPQRFWRFWALQGGRWVSVGDEVRVEQPLAGASFASGGSVPAVALRWGSEVNLVSALGHRERLRDLARWGVGATAFTLEPIAGGVRRVLGEGAPSALVPLARTPESASVARHEGDWVGVVLHCGRSSGGGDDDLGCELTGLDLGAEPAARASTSFEAVGRNDWVFAADGAGMAVFLIHHPGMTSGARERRLEVVTLDGPRARRVGPPLTLTALPRGRERVFGLNMTPRPRVAYLDSPRRGVPDHLRVAVLSSRGWSDVVEPFAVGDAVAVSMSPERVVVATFGEEGELRSAELVGSRWRRIELRAETSRSRDAGADEGRPGG